MAFTPPILARVFGCVCLFARSACTLQVVAGVCGVGVCARVLGFGCGLPFLAGVVGCVCLCVRFARTSPILAAVCGACVWACSFRFHPAILDWDAGVRVFVCALRLQSANSGSGVRCV